MITNFYKRFWLEVSYEEWKEKFINRVNEIILDDIKNKTYNYFNNYRYENIVEYLCLELGLNSSSYYNPRHNYQNKYKWLEYITQNSFEKTLQILELLIEINNWRANIEKLIKVLIDKSINRDHIDLWINLKNWIFYPSWNKELDKEIIEESLSNIKWYKAEKDYHEAITNYLKWDLHWTLDMCFTTLETFSKEILWNTKWLNANKWEILKYFGWSDDFSKQWNWILNWLYTYLNDYWKRHDWEKRDETEKLEVQSTLYLTGTIINLLKEKNSELWKQ